MLLTIVLSDAALDKNQSIELCAISGLQMTLNWTVKDSND
jgi:hypothetical protein